MSEESFLHPFVSSDLSGFTTFVFSDTCALRHVVDGMSKLTNLDKHTFFAMGTCVAREVAHQGYQLKINSHPLFDSRIAHIPSKNCSPTRISILIDDLFEKCIRNVRFDKCNKYTSEPFTLYTMSFDDFRIDISRSAEYDNLTNDLTILIELYNFVRNMRVLYPNASYYFWTDDAMLFRLFKDQKVIELIKDFGICHEDDVDCVLPFRPY